MHRYGMLDRPDLLFRIWNLSFRETTINRYSIEWRFQLSIQLHHDMMFNVAHDESVVDFLSHWVDERTMWLFVWFVRVAPLDRANLPLG
jgi:hypothetical protein